MLILINFYNYKKGGKRIKNHQNTIRGVSSFDITFDDAFVYLRDELNGDQAFILSLPIYYIYL